ncbi:DUF6114 domain-containing protein [Luteimicrobium sp. NPDC057192]|uniref:DUF6114 domain-containing protein n=1 Tax=Luteimicrobium sp. NPDC057192 TaxID=3346042 RepID=UPI00362FF33E
MSTTDEHDPTTADTGVQQAAATEPTKRERFRAWRRGRPFWGGLLLVLAGVEMFLSGQLDLGHIHVQFGVEGMQAMILPLILALLGVLIWAMPVHRIFYGVIALLLAIYSLIGVNLGGFIVGMVLGIVGAVVAISWLPTVAPVDEEAPEAVTPEAARPRHAEGLDLTGSAPTTDDTLVLEDASGPRPFVTASADTDALPETPRRARLNAIGVGVLASTLALGGTGMLGATGAVPTADESGWCVLDPLHVFCPTDDESASDTATSAPTDAPTSTTSPTEDASDDDGTGDAVTSGGTPSGSSDTETSAPADGATTDEGAGSTGGDTPSSGTDGTTGTADSSGDATDAPASGATDDARDDKADGTTDQASVEAAAKEGVEALADQLKLCLGEGKDLGSSSDITAPNLSSHLSGSKFEITNSWYKGNVSLTRVDGSTVRAMKFTADKAVVPGFRLDVPAKADGSQGLVATSDSITMKGDVLLYATKFSGKLLGIPLTFTPECAPPGFIPLPSMTDVKIEMVANTAQSLAYDNPHQEVYEH